MLAKSRSRRPSLSKRVTTRDIANPSLNEPRSKFHCTAVSLTFFRDYRLKFRHWRPVVTAKRYMNAAIPIWNQLCGQTLVWIGVVGSVLTIIENWSKFMTPPDWIRGVEDEFSAITNQFFGFI